MTHTQRRSRAFPNEEITLLAPGGTTRWRRLWFDIIFRHDTPPARNFDLLLIAAIIASVLVVMADSVADIHARYGYWLWVVEWILTGMFTVEYVLRLIVVRQWWRYGLSIWGLIDIVSILPAFLSLVLPGSQALLTVRVLRMLRMFRR